MWSSAGPSKRSTRLLLLARLDEYLSTIKSSLVNHQITTKQRKNVIADIICWTWISKKVSTYFFLRATYEFSSLTCTQKTSLDNYKTRKNNWKFKQSEGKNKKGTIDCRLSFNIRLVLASFPLSKLLTSLSKSLIRLLQSRILSVRSSSCLLCLLASLIFSSFWNPFLVAK